MSELRALIDAGITARAILEPLRSCPVDAPAVEMARTLAQRDFDVAGVQIGDSGPVIGFVTTASLTEGIVRDHLMSLTAEHLISDTTPIPTVLSVLKAKPRVFVLAGPEVNGLVTRTDLNKPPLRIYMFGLISLLEMHLTFWVRAEYDETSLHRTLKEPRIVAAQKIQTERKALSQEVDLFDCIQLCDKRDLLLKRQEICDRLGLIPKPEAVERLKRLESTRNLLAHNQQNLVEGSSWEELIALIEWMESVVHRSDDLVEEYAATAAQKGLADLWSAA